MAVCCKACLLLVTGSACVQYILLGGMIHDPDELKGDVVEAAESTLLVHWGILCQGNVIITVHTGLLGEIR